jgi:hypothetical protein
MTMTRQLQFPIFSRILHWTMAVLVLAMLFIGIGMVSSPADYHWLVSTHWPLSVRNDCAAARETADAAARHERRRPPRPTQGTPPATTSARN